jgi:hypothetical protein
MVDGKGPQLPPGLKAAIEAIARVPSFKPISIPKIDLSAITKAHQNSLAIFPEIQRQFARQSEQMLKLQQQIKKFNLPSQAAIEQMAEMARRAQSAFPKLPQPSAEQFRIFEQLAKNEIRKNALDRIGVLPHASTPLSLLDVEQSDDELRAALERRYRESWPEVSQGILERLQQLSIDDEAKEAFAEALQAHGNGHYRSVCRLLLPEIERVARVELFGNAVGIVHVNKVVGEPALELPMSATKPAGYLALVLYERLNDHLYMKVGTANRADFEHDLVPNRHAAIHGLVVYNSFWNALNTIFMTDFAFQLISAIKALGASPSETEQ